MIDSIREAEQKARHAFERAVDISDDAQRRIRQKMRIYPRPAEPTIDPGSTDQQASTQEPIVSIKGKDVSPEEVAKEPADPTPTPRERRRRSAA